MSRHAFLFGIALALVLGAAAAAAARDATDIAKKISLKDGARLAAEAVGGSSRSMWDGDRKMVPPYYVYAWIGNGVIAVMGYLQVNPWTGDVWDMWSCNRLSTPALTKSQARIRRQFTREELKFYDELHDMTPPCDFGDGNDNPLPDDDDDDDKK